MSGATWILMRSKDEPSYLLMCVVASDNDAKHDGRGSLATRHSLAFVCDASLRHATSVRDHLCDSISSDNQRFASYTRQTTVSNQFVMVDAG